MSDDKKIIDKAKDAAADAKEKVSDFVGEHEEQIHDAIEKTGEFVDDKVTRHKFSDKIDRAQDAVKGAVSKIGSRGGAPGTTETDKGETKTTESPKPKTTKAQSKKAQSKKPDTTKGRNEETKQPKESSK